MTRQDKAQNEKVIQSTIEYLESKGYENIKADIDGYESPKSFIMKSKDIELTPDIVAETNGQKHYIEVGVKTEKKRLLKTKWKFLKTLSEIKGRHFKIISHKGHYGFTDRLLSEMELSTKAVRI